jgi:hypothetical protein
MRLPAWTLFGILAVSALCPADGAAQVDDGPDLGGVIDLHAHVAPDTAILPFRRSVDAIEAAQLARIHGMRAMVFKEHNTETASWAYLVSQVVPGIELFGGIVLNRAVGGINPVAVESMALTRGNRGRIVYMPTMDSEYYNPGSPDAVPVSRDGELLPEVHEVLEVMAEYDLGLSTGHSRPEESLMLIEAAREAGVDKIYVQHPTDGRILMAMDTMKEAVRLGALIEIELSRAGLTEQKLADIRELGPENVLVTSDLGQPGNVTHAEGFRQALTVLREAGFSQAEIDTMTRINPARFLGLE